MPAVMQTEVPHEERDSEAPPTQQDQSTYLLPTLRNLFTKSLQNTLSKCSYPAFAACFPTPAAKRPETLKTVWKQIVDKVESKAFAEFDAVCLERDLNSRFAELEGVLQSAKVEKERAAETVDGQANGKGAGGLHTLPPPDLFLATLAPQLTPVAKQLEDRSKNQQMRNDSLIQELLNKRAEIEAIVKSLESVVADVEEANKVLYTASKEIEDVPVE